MNNRNWKNPSHFDAGRTGVFPGSCLLRGRHPGYPAPQAIPHTPALGAVAAGVMTSRSVGIRDGAGEAPGRGANGRARQARATKANRPEFSWWLRSMTSDDGRRVITLWRSASANSNQPRALNHRRAFRCRAALSLRVQFAREGVPTVLQIVARGGRLGAVPGPSGCSLSNSALAGPGARSPLSAPRQQALSPSGSF